MENRTNKLLIAGSIVAIIAVSIAAVIFLTGSVVLPESFPDSGNSQADPSATAITTTPTHPPKPSPIELPIGTPVSGSITNTTTLNKYAFAVPQTGTLALSISRDIIFGPTYLSIMLFDSAGVLIEGSDSQYLGMQNMPIAHASILDLEAGTYFIEIAPVDDYIGDYWLSVVWYGLKY